MHPIQSFSSMCSQEITHYCLHLPLSVLTLNDVVISTPRDIITHFLAGSFPAAGILEVVLQPSNVTYFPHSPASGPVIFKNNRQCSRSHGRWVIDSLHLTTTLTVKETLQITASWHNSPTNPSLMTGNHHRCPGGLCWWTLWPDCNKLHVIIVNLTPIT